MRGIPLVDKMGGHLSFPSEPKGEMRSWARNSSVIHRAVLAAVEPRAPNGAEGSSYTTRTRYSGCHQGKKATIVSTVLSGE